MELEQLIRSNIRFEKESSGGFNMARGSCCNDYQARLGIKFEHGTIGANCFNCGFKARYTELDGRVSSNFRKLLLGYNIDEEDIDKCVATSFINRRKVSEDENITLQTIKKVNLFTPEVDLPEGAVLLKSAPDSETKRKLISYLESRHFNVDSYHWYFIPDNFKDNHLKQRIIIPYFKAGKLIYWQARTINQFVKKRYLNCETPKAAVIFGYDALYSWSNKPLFITEGVFDAIAVGGVCLLGSVLSEEALTILKRTKRRVIFVIDKDKKGKALGMQVIDNGWEITTAPTGTDDINDSIVKNGKLFTVYHLLTNTYSGFNAKVQLNLKCK